MKNKQSREDKGQSSIFDFGDFTEEEKVELQSIPTPIPISHENHIEDSNKFKEESDNKDLSNLRSEQIHISKKNYPSISDSDNKNSFSIEIIKSGIECTHLFLLSN